MIDQILLNNVGYPNYNQNAFNINQFRNKANQLMGNNLVMINLNEELENLDFNNFNRQSLLNVWSDENISITSKIILTFWWGGISHQNQAPLFYTAENLNNIFNFSINLEEQLYTISQINDIEQFRNQLNLVYNNFKVIDGAFYMSGISTSFFTKLFQFYFQANGNDFIRERLPIIADKWTMRAVFADMLNNDDYENWETLFRTPRFHQITNNFSVSFTGGQNNEFNRYWEFITYFNNRVNELSQEFDTLNAFDLEAVVFGWANDINNVNNPRYLSTTIITNYIFN